MCGGMLPLTSSVTVGQDLNLSEPHCPPVAVSERCHGDELSDSPIHLPCEESLLQGGQAGKVSPIRVGIKGSSA